MNEKALRVASEKGDLQTVLELIQKGVDINACGPETGRTALHWACEKGHKEIITILVEQNINLNAQDKNLDTPLHLLITAKEISLHKKLELSQLLLNKQALPFIENASNKTFLMLLANLRDDIAIKKLNVSRDLCIETIRITKKVVMNFSKMKQISVALRNNGSVVFGTPDSIIENPQNFINRSGVTNIIPIDTTSTDEIVLPYHP